MTDWCPDLSRSAKPRYLAIADIIADDVKSGRLADGERLPPQRTLAKRLAIDFTTVARGYVEAQRRGLVDSRVGQGTFVRGAKLAGSRGGDHRDIVDLSMNLPPEPSDADLVVRMREGLADVARDLVGLLRYQGFGGSRADKEAASAWLGRRALVPKQERVFVTPGAHPAIQAILSMLARGGRLRVVRGDHLSRRPLDRGPARPRAGRPPNGRAGHRARCSRRGLPHPSAQGALPQPDAAEPHDPDRSGATARGHRCGGASPRPPDHRGRRLRLHSGQRRASDRQHRARPHLAHRRPRQMHQAPDFAPPMSWRRTRAPVGRSRRRCGPPT